MIFLIYFFVCKVNDFALLLQIKLLQKKRSRRDFRDSSAFLTLFGVVACQILSRLITNQPPKICNSMPGMPMRKSCRAA